LNSTLKPPLLLAVLCDCGTLFPLNSPSGCALSSGMSSRGRSPPAPPSPSAPRPPIAPCRVSLESTKPAAFVRMRVILSLSESKSSFGRWHVKERPRKQRRGWRFGKVTVFRPYKVVFEIDLIHPPQRLLALWRVAAEKLFFVGYSGEIW